MKNIDKNKLVRIIVMALTILIGVAVLTISVLMIIDKMLFDVGNLINIWLILSICLLNLYIQYVNAGNKTNGVVKLMIALCVIVATLAITNTILFAV